MLNLLRRLERKVRPFFQPPPLLFDFSEEVCAACGNFTVVDDKCLQCQALKEKPDV